MAKSATVTTNDPANPTLVITMRARILGAPPPDKPTAQPVKIVGPFAVEPSPRWVTSAISGTSSAGTLFFYNPETTPVHIKKVEPGGTDFTATLVTLQDGKRYQLSVATNPALKPGTYKQTVKVETDSATTPNMQVELEATVFPHVFASPTSILFPTLPASSDLSAINWPKVYVRKVREGGLKITSFSTDISFLKLNLETELEGQVYAIRLSLDQSKIKPGAFQGKIHIETNDKDVPTIEVPVKGQFN
ncbi:MAG TPA: hypothetical protein VNN73_17190 [Blastocatellia bacterium]|nr:hypothetical protein [Blastocatellia bacterium]